MWSRPSFETRFDRSLLRVESDQVVGLRAAKALQRPEVIDRLENIRLPGAVVSMNDVEVRAGLEAQRPEVAKPLRAERDHTAWGLRRHPVALDAHGHDDADEIAVVPDGFQHTRIPLTAQLDRDLVVWQGAQRIE